MRKKNEKIRKRGPRVPKRADAKIPAAYAKPPQKGFAPPKGGLEGSFVKYHSTRWGGTPAHWDAPRGFARQRGGPDIENSNKVFETCKKLSHASPDASSKSVPDIYQNLFKIEPKSSPNLPKTLPKSTLNRCQRPLGAHLGTMLAHV